ncbi:hypothetical protein [Jiella pelagia]|uniref:Uncharacterized protein n=1 Tax=Jiella pelagia TaxID=2986949 RepID=A0ABY7C2D7_9HYPH|nr:hypothetical protein [Jiella pelagia]WAP69878.1 hypothetical protein OH818_06740 [Jiella pelagia]
MSIRRTSIILLTAQVTVLLTSLGAGAQDAEQQANRPTSAAVQTEAGQQIPAGAYGVAQIDAPRVATLLQLRGVIGTGIAILRSDDSHDCLTVPIRFVAGDFGGDGISANATKPIRLILRSRRVARGSGGRRGRGQRYVPHQQPDGRHRCGRHHPEWIE